MEKKLFYIPFIDLLMAKVKKIRASRRAIPDHGERMCLFIDCKKMEISRPTGNNNAQAYVYNGESKIHCLKFLGASAPDGMIVYVSRPQSGNHHDSFVFGESHFNEMLRDIQIGEEEQYWSYGDKAFPRRSHNRAAYRGRNLPLLRSRSNYTLSSQRIGVEWSYCKIGQLEKFVDNSNKMKIQLSQVGKFFIVACLLANAHTCLYGSSSSKYWKCNPPKLGTYFNKPELNMNI